MIINHVSSHVRMCMLYVYLTVDSNKLRCQVCKKVDVGEEIDALSPWLPHYYNKGLILVYA